MSTSTEHRDIHGYTPKGLIAAVQARLDQKVAPDAIYAELGIRPPTEFGAGPQYGLLVPLANLLRTMAGWGPHS